MPDPVTWYTLPRTVDDVESIMEVMDEKLLTHNQDPSAHGQSGEGLFTHRIATLLDHAERSIDFKYLVADNFLISTAFSSLDGWETIGATLASILNSYVATSGALNNVAELYLERDEVGLDMTPSKNPYFQTTVALSHADDQLAYIVAGDVDGAGNDDSFGFKIVDGALYAYWTKGGVANTQVIAGITLTNYNVYRAYLDSTVGEIYFYINDVLEYTATANFPTDANSMYFNYYIKATEAVVHKIFMVDFYFQQDR